MNRNNIELSMHTDCALIDESTPSERYVEVRIISDNLPPGEDRAPLNIALVIDRSGSMGGDKLRYAQNAACFVLDHLDERDRASVVAYDDEIGVVAPSRPVSSIVSNDLKRDINALRPGNSTDLCGGWLRGSGDVAEHILPHGVNRALLLTDGLANVGITDPEIIAHHAYELNQRGVSTSTFGIGLDYNEVLLQHMAERGGGHYYFIANPIEIPAIFRRELGELLTVIAREAILNVYLPEGISAQLLGHLPHERREGALRVPLADLFAGQRREIYLRVRSQGRTAEPRIEFRAELTFADLTSTAKTARAKAVLSFADSESVTRAVRDLELARGSG